MGFFDKLFDVNNNTRIFEPRYCNICGKELSLMNAKQKLRDGLCCKNCAKKLSPFFHKPEYATVEEIKYQIACREKNNEKVQHFNATRVIGVDTKVIIDEDKGQFVISNTKFFKGENPDVIDFADVINCFVDTTEKRTEIKYLDSLDNVKSFVPPCYAYSYDFYVAIDTKIPYLETIEFKLNAQPIDNGEETLIEMEGGLVNNIVDALRPTRSYGKTSNAAEVKSSMQYQKYQRIATEIYNTLLSNCYQKRQTVSLKPKTVICPWCGSKVIMDDDNICDHCLGPLNRL